LSYTRNPLSFLNFSPLPPVCFCKVFCNRWLVNVEIAALGAAGNRIVAPELAAYAPDRETVAVVGVTLSAR
jgi:hypothetical protein